MAVTQKVLGQLYPTASTMTDLYTVPAATTAVISSIVICNSSSTATSFSVVIRKAGAALSNPQYIYNTRPIGSNDTFILTGGITLAATDVISVYATLGTLSFNLFGQENS